MSIAQQSLTATTSLGFNSPPVTPMQGKAVDQECSSKTPTGIPVRSEDEDDDNATLATLKCPSPATKHSASKAPRKSPDKNE
ncbi:hypothetical protein OsI_28336 [Oryza sativa Indica Group]|uniref:Uncharacterized protein n=2 Tax=Oryza sativa TaxID=4530 RepID=B9FZQ9_ORYSJ|nr:hypothetical protein OsI_28336 [Oryza sativa Indica Group]EEE68276.1 hypothetical protein OsJ_26510 [Oryza sativa Japonica Group]